jgi:hypothetical protein
MSAGALRTPGDVTRFFQERRTPITFVHSAPSTLLGADRWINGLTFVTSVDAFDGCHPHNIVPAGATRAEFRTTEAGNNYLLQHPAVVAHLGRSRANLLFLVFNGATEALAQRLGLQIWLPAASLRRRLDDKIAATQLAERAGVPAVPHVVAKGGSYDRMRRVCRHLGDDVVVQLPFGDAGGTTYFISCEADFRPHARRIARQPAIKIMKRICCRPLTIEGCVTRRGTLVGPLLTELVGFDALTPRRGGWCGNELRGADGGAPLPTELRRAALDATTAIGARLAQQGYRGNFGVDFLLDEDTGRLCFGELNPRLTGVTMLTAQAALDRAGPPLFLFHLLEWLGLDYTIDVQEFNERSCLADPLLTWSSLVIYHTRPSVERLTRAPEGGVWRMSNNGRVRFARRAFHLQAIRDERDALLFRSLNTGQRLVQGCGCGRLLMRGRASTDGGLTPRAVAWTAGFRAQLESAPMGAAPTGRRRATSA